MMEDIFDDYVEIPEDGGVEQLKLTASFVDAVNFGNSQLAEEIIQNETLNLDIDMGVIEQYMCSVPVKARVDVLNSKKDVMAEQPIGCIFIQNFSHLLDVLMRSTSRPAVVTDHDALISTYVSDIPTYQIVLANYPLIMVNKKLRSTERTHIPYLKSFKQMFPYCFTPLHAVLHSFFVNRQCSLHYTRTLSSYRCQCVKVHLLLTLGAVIDGNTSYAMSLAGQLIFHEEFALFEKCVNMGVLSISGDEMDNLFGQFVRYFRLDSITYIFKSPFCGHLDFVMNDEFLGHYGLVQKGFLRRCTEKQKNVLTEHLLHNYFYFTGDLTYSMNLSDSSARICNLYHAGVYIKDRQNAYEFMNKNDPLGREVGMILKASKTPFTLEKLCSLKIKSVIGPKHHYYKLKQLVNKIPTHLLHTMAMIRYTKNSRRPVQWYIPQERVGDAPYSDVFNTKTRADIVI